MMSCRIKANQHRLYSRGASSCSNEEIEDVSVGRSEDVLKKMRNHMDFLPWSAAVINVEVIDTDTAEDTCFRLFQCSQKISESVHAKE